MPEWLFEFASDLSSQEPLPAVLSISYAWSELDQCDIAPGEAPCQGGGPVQADASRAFVTAVNQLLAAAAARGTTLIAASGDSGAHGRSDPYCLSAATRADFPASSPYVTAVGATELVGAAAGAAPEPICAATLQCVVAAAGEAVASPKTSAPFSSGGGFSNVAARPAWQADAVARCEFRSSLALRERAHVLC